MHKIAQEEQNNKLQILKENNIKQQQLINLKQRCQQIEQENYYLKEEIKKINDMAIQDQRVLQSTNQKLKIELSGKNSNSLDIIKLNQNTQQMTKKISIIQKQKQFAINQLKDAQVINQKLRKNNEELFYQLENRQNNIIEQLKKELKKSQEKNHQLQQKIKQINQLNSKNIYKNSINSSISFSNIPQSKYFQNPNNQNIRSLQLQLINMKQKDKQKQQYIQKIKNQFEGQFENDKNKINLLKITIKKLQEEINQLRQQSYNGQRDSHKYSEDPTQLQKKHSRLKQIQLKNSQNRYSNNSLNSQKLQQKTQSKLIINRQFEKLIDQNNLLQKRLNRANLDIQKLKNCLDQNLLRTQLTPRQPTCAIQRAIWMIQTLTDQILKIRKQIQQYKINYKKLNLDYDQLKTILKRYQYQLQIKRKKIYNNYRNLDPYENFQDQFYKQKYSIRNSQNLGNYNIKNYSNNLYSINSISNRRQLDHTKNDKIIQTMNSQIELGNSLTKSKQNKISQISRYKSEARLKQERKYLLAKMKQDMKQMLSD